jgi:hypothetical protein
MNPKIPPKVCDYQGAENLAKAKDCRQQQESIGAM